MKRAHELGMALLTVLLMVAVMSAIAVGVLDDIRFGIRRAANAEAMSQARWYAQGAESLAGVRLARLLRTEGGGEPPPASWSGRPMSFPIEDGVITARLSDGSACFNLNSVVEGAGEQLARRPLGLGQFRSLLLALGFSAPQAEALGDALADFIDSDGARGPSGAEDETYAAGARSYRTSGTLLAEPSELRAVRGFGPDVYRTLRPFVCALPTTELSPLNVNALTEAHAPLLVMLTDGDLPLAAAREVIRRRPPQGWSDISAFWADQALADIVPADPVVNQVAVRTRFVRLEADVALRGAEAGSTALLQIDSAGRAKVVARRWGPEE